MRNRWLAALLVVMLFGCARQASGPGKVDWNRAADAVVFQVDTSAGFVMPIYAETMVPEITVFGDGRVLVARRDGPVVEARLPVEKVAELMARADKDLTGLKPQYTAAQVTDMGTTVFSVVTAGGKKQVSVYAFNEQPWERENDRAVMDRLRALRKAFLDAVPADAKPYVPDELKLVTFTVDPVAEAKAWPADLPALPMAPQDQPLQMATTILKGEEARKVAAQVPYRSGPPQVYKVGQKYFEVAVAPVIPVIR